MQHLFQVDGVMVPVASLPYNGPGFKITEDDADIVVTLDNGVIIRYDGNHRASVCVPSHCGGALTGICGNFDGNKGNDYRTSTGARVTNTRQNHQIIGKSWITNRR